MILSAARTYHTRKARTRLNLAAGHLEGAVNELRQACLPELVGTTNQALLGVYEVLRALPVTTTTTAGRRP
jgi:hypothetical protein